MDNETRLYLVNCPYCHHTIGLATELEMYHKSFWCRTCSQGIKVDMLHLQKKKKTIPRRKNTSYNDI